MAAPAAPEDCALKAAWATSKVCVVIRYVSSDVMMYLNLATLEYSTRRSDRSTQMSECISDRILHYRVITCHSSV